MSSFFNIFVFKIWLSKLLKTVVIHLVYKGTWVSLESFLKGVQPTG